MTAPVIDFETYKASKLPPWSVVELKADKILIHAGCPTLELSPGAAETLGAQLIELARVCRERGGG